MTAEATKGMVSVAELRKRAPWEDDLAEAGSPEVHNDALSELLRIADNLADATSPRRENK